MPTSKTIIEDHHIYLFCNAGVGRSPSVAIAYLCCYRGGSFGEVVGHVVRRKPGIRAYPRLIKRIEAVRSRLEEEQGNDQFSSPTGSGVGRFSRLKILPIGAERRGRCRSFLS